MQVLFCHDGPLRVDDKGNYYGIAHNDELFQRYKIIANDIAVAIRTKQIKRDEKTEKLSKIRNSPFKVYDVPNISSTKGFVDRNIAKKIIEEAVIESDYVVARLPSMIGNIAIDFAKKNNKPYLTEVVACPWDAYWNHSTLGKVVAPFMYLATKRCVKNSNYVIYVTNEFLQRRYPTKGKSVNCSNVALTEFNETILNNRLKKIKATNKYGKNIIGTTAAVNVKYKGQQFIIKALGQLKKQGHTNYEYQLVGDGDQSFLKSIAEKYNVTDQVKFLGPMLHKDVFDWLETIDLYTQPSRQEGLPRALIEAMSRGLPSFGANTAGIPELLENEYIFNNNYKNTTEIINILKGFSLCDMKEQAEKNYIESKKYDKKIIDKKRNEFFFKFKESNKSSP